MELESLVGVGGEGPLGDAGAVGGGGLPDVHGQALCRLTRLITPPPWSTTCHCWLEALVSACWVMSAPLLLLLATWSTRPLCRARIRWKPPPESMKSNCWLSPLWTVHCCSWASSVVRPTSALAGAQLWQASLDLVAQH